MTHLPRDRISVDLRGLRGAVCEKARVLGISPSELVRRVLADALAGAVPSTRATSGSTAMPAEGLVRLCLRMTHSDAQATRVAAKRAGLSCGAYIAGIVGGIPVLLEGSAAHN